jgi:two-component system sensor kinase FixL
MEKDAEIKPPPSSSQYPHSQHIVLVLLDENAVIEQLHINCLDLLAEPPHTLLGKNWFESCVPQHIRAQALATFNDLLNRADPHLNHHSYPILTASTKEQLLVWSSLPRVDQQQSVTGLWLSGFSFSVHEADQQDIDTVLRLSQLNAQVVLDNAIESIMTITPTGIITSFNKAAESMFGYRVEEVIGNNINMLMPAPYKNAHDGYLANYLRTGHKKIIGIGREVTGLRKDKSEFPMELAVSEVIIDNERSFTGIIRDISERKEAELQLLKRDGELEQIRDRMAHMDRLHLMGEMATGIAHELNQPLTAIATYAQACGRLVNSSMKHADDLAHSLQQIDAQSQRAGEVIRSLRAMVTKQRQPHLQTNINTLIKETIELANIDPSVSDTVIETQQATIIHSIEVDTIQIQQVILNLIRNAVDAMADYPTKDKHIIISTTEDETNIRVSIADNGPGIPNTDKNEIFNPFFTTKPNSEGMGMGLAICRSIITAHDGELILNTSNSNGAEFYFTLPIISTL